MKRKEFLKKSGLWLAGMALGGEVVSSMPFARETVVGESLQAEDIPLMDLHVHRSDDLTLDDMLAVSRKLKMKIGVMENIAPWGITNDSQLETYLDALNGYPFFVGLQPMSPGWSKNFSPELIARADYIVFL